MDLDELRALATAAQGHDVSSFLDLRQEITPETVLAMLDEIERTRKDCITATLDAERAREERNRIGVEIRREWMGKCNDLRNVLRDIMTEKLIPAEYPLLMARAKAALDGGGA